MPVAHTYLSSLFSIFVVRITAYFFLLHNYILLCALQQHTQIPPGIT
jgi:hypothetical protein